MTFHFVGGEDCNFLPVGTTSIDTTAGHFRSGYARSALKLTSLSATDGWRANLPSAISEFWVSGQTFQAGTGTTAWGLGCWLNFYKGATRRLALGTDGISAGTTKPTLFKLNAALASTQLDQSGSAFTMSVLQKIDCYVKYAVAGAFKLYVNGVLQINFSGDMTTDGVTDLDSINFGAIFRNGSGGAAAGSWSEIIVSDSDTRGLALSTLVPLAAGNTQAWSGSVTDINESTLDDTTLLSTTTANQLAQFTVTPLASITSTVGVRAVVVTARAAKGASGPANFQGSVRTAATDYVSGTIALPSTFGNVQAAFTTNPNTSAAWTGSNITTAGFNLGLKSIT